MAAGRPPFPGRGTGAVMLAHAREAPPLELLAEVLEPTVVKVVGACLAKSREARPQSMTALLALLDTAAAAIDQSRRQLAAHPTAEMAAVADDTLVDSTFPDMPTDPEGEPRDGDAPGLKRSHTPL